MAYARVASQLKLIGLLLICTSVLTFLVLSACGVDSVRVNTPLAQRLATKWQLTSNQLEAVPAQGPPVATPVAASPVAASPVATGTLLSAAPAFDPQPRYAPTAGRTQVLPPGYTSDPYTFSSGFDFPAAASAAPLADEAVDTAAAAVGLRIPLWCIIGFFLLIGFVLWSMPQPRPSAYAAGRRR